MFAAGINFFVLGLTFITNGYALKSSRYSSDTISGEEYISKEDYDKVSVGKPEPNDDWIVMPDGNGTPKIALMKSELKTFPTVTTEEATQFHLYTRSNPEDSKIINMDDFQSVNFNGSRPTKILIHGWRSNPFTKEFTAIREAYLKKADMNVIGVDWSKIAENIFYPAPAAETKNVGEYVGRMIDNLVESKGANYEDFHIIGHSLGSHVAGSAGLHTKKKISRITGLDPALPCFQDNEPDYRLDDTDAAFVDVIHTCAGVLGIIPPIGHADFYPNGGTLQPGCCCLAEGLNACSHSRSQKYFAESIKSKAAFEGIRCKSWETFKRGRCEEDVVPMGEYTPTTARGVFYLLTESRSPYGLGIEGISFNTSNEAR